MRAPASGWLSANSARSAMRPGISCSASWISLRPQPARERSATLKSPSEGHGHGLPGRATNRLRGTRCVEGWGIRHHPDQPGRRLGGSTSTRPSARFEVVEHGDGAGVDAGLDGEVQRHEVALDDQVEQLAPGRPRPRPRRRGCVHDLVEHVVGEVEPAGHLRVLEVVAEATTVITWRVTSPCWPQPQISLWPSSGSTLANAGALAFSFTWHFQR